MMPSMLQMKERSLHPSKRTPPDVSHQTQAGTNGFSLETEWAKCQQFNYIAASTWLGAWRSIFPGSSSPWFLIPSHCKVIPVNEYSNEVVLWLKLKWMNLSWLAEASPAAAGEPSSPKARPMKQTGQFRYQLVKFPQPSNARHCFPNLVV